MIAPEQEPTAAELALATLLHETDDTDHIDQARALLARGVRLDDDPYREIKSAFWVHYRCEFVGCPTVEPHEHGGEPTMVAPALDTADLDWQDAR